MEDAQREDARSSSNLLSLPQIVHQPTAMSGLLDLPSEVLDNINGFLSLDGLKSLRSTCKILKQSVDHSLDAPKMRKRIRCVVDGYESGVRLSECPPKWAHSELVLDIPFPEEVDSFYRLDFTLYLQSFAKFVTKLECNWFLGLSTREEFCFLDAFENLERLVFLHVTDESIFDFLIMELPRSLLNVTDFKTSWSPVFQSLKWLINRSFQPKFLKFLDIAADEVVEFLKAINQHIDLRFESNNNLRILQFDEYCVTHDINIPVDVLTDFTVNAVKCQLKIEGVSSFLLYKIEHVVENRLFSQFLKCLISMNGLHPIMRNEKLANLEVIKLKESPMELRDFRWTKTVANRILPSLTSVDIVLKIDANTININRRVECKTALSMIEAALGNESPKLVNLTLNLQKPDWYPLFVPIDSYVKRFVHLKKLDLTMFLNCQEVGTLFESLQFCRVESIKLSDCFVSDESFKRGKFLCLTYLKSFSLTCNDPCTMQFLTDETFFDVISRSSLVQLHFKGSFPLVTANGIRFIAFGEKIGATVHSLIFETPDESLEIRQALDLVSRKCMKNIARENGN